MALYNKIYLEDGHDLRETASRTEGEFGQNRFWSYEEINGTGAVVATWEYWECVEQTPPFKNIFGFKKFGLDGSLLEEDEF